MRIALIVLLSGCSFDPPTFSEPDGGSMIAKDASAEDADDGALDADLEEGGAADGEAGEQDAVITCAADTIFCEGRRMMRCNSAGSGIVPGSEVLCDFTCAAGACVRASNLPGVDYRDCDETAPALAPVGSATVTIDGASITCDPNCGDPLRISIPLSGMLAPADAPPLTWYCLSRLELGPQTTVRQGTNVTQAVALFVDGEAIISTPISIAGGAGMMMSGGAAGLGAGAGAPRAGGMGASGLGRCPGMGGGRVGSLSNYAAGGGGGGGHAGTGGTGGNGRNSSDNEGSGGAGGGVCGNAELIPLHAGSGGGGGADEGCMFNCGWAGGGGGGALQISSRVRIAITAPIDASGGDGYGVFTGGPPPPPTGGAGGGGSGGAILLEAPSIDVSATISIDGGNGARSTAGDGGAGATADVLDGAPGANADESRQAGAGGGGAAGRVRFNASSGSNCNQVSVPTSCSEGPLLAP